MTTKPTELRIGAPEHFDGSYEKAISWLNSVQFYLLVNAAVYDNDNKKIAFALSYMTKGSAATWASTFRQKCFTAAGVLTSLGTFDDFVKAFKAAFEHHDIVGQAIRWLSTTRMTKDKSGVWQPPLLDFISTFKNKVAQAQIVDENVLIGYFSAGIPPFLMRRIFTMDTAPTTVAVWYDKATHFLTQWERSDEVASRNKNPAKITYRSYTTPSSSKTADPDAMDVDVIRVAKLTPDERKKCIEKGLCFRCRKAGHLSSACPSFPSSKKPQKRIQRISNDETLPRLEPVEDDDDEPAVRRISFNTLDF